jgi:hypothetical protein
MTEFINPFSAYSLAGDSFSIRITNAADILVFERDKYDVSIVVTEKPFKPGWFWATKGYYGDTPIEERAIEWHDEDPSSSRYAYERVLELPDLNKAREDSNTED